MVSEETMKKRKIKDYTNLGGMIHARIISSSEGHFGWKYLGWAKKYPGTEYISLKIQM